MMFPTHPIGREIDASDRALSVARTRTESVWLNGPTINGLVVRDLRGRLRVALFAPGYRKFALLFPWNRRGTGNPRRSDRPAETYASAGLRRFGASGRGRRWTPDASKTALAMAAATGRIELSPAPAGGSSGRLISTISIASGASVMSRIG